MLKKNELYRAAVTGFTSDGLGVCRVEGCAVFVPNAAPDEEYDLRITHVGKNSAHGKIVNIITKSVARVNRACPYAKRCGGCRFWHLTYEAECELKRQRVLDALNRLGGQSLETLALTPAPTCEGDRNKAQYPVTTEKNKPIAGFYREGTHEVVAVKRCLILPECADRAKQAVLDWMRQFRVPAYDETQHSGLVRHIFVRHAEATGQVMVCIVANGARHPRENELVGALRDRVPGLRTVVLNSNLRRGNAVLGDETRTLWGDGFIEDVLCGRCAGEKAVVESPLYPGLSVISAPYEGGEVKTGALQALCQTLGGCCDYLILYTAAGMGAAFQAARACAHRALLVLGADPVSLRDGRIVSDALYNGGLTDIRLVLNRVGPKTFRTGAVRDLDECIDTVCAQLIAVVPESAEVQLAAAKGEALPEDCLAFEAVDRLARRVMGRRVGLAVK